MNKKDNRHCKVCSMPLIITKGNGVKKITSKKMKACAELLTKCFLSQICNDIIIIIPARQLTIKGTITLFEKKRDTDKIKVYKIDEEAEAN